jgi:hypothetical protein
MTAVPAEMVVISSSSVPHSGLARLELGSSWGVGCGSDSAVAGRRAHLASAVRCYLSTHAPLRSALHLMTGGNKSASEMARLGLVCVLAKGQWECHSSIKRLRQ